MKNELRCYYKDKRKLLSEDDISLLSSKIAANLLTLLPDTAANIHTFLPIVKFKEVDTYLIMKEINEQKPYLKWIVSQTDFDTYDWYHYYLNEKTELAENKFGILEPINGDKANTEDIDSVLVPLLAFDNKGKRIGYGKGIYDRFMAQCPWRTKFIGLSFFEACTAPIPADEWDIDLHYCATPNKKYGF